ncbi:sortase [Mycetocola sp. 2940]|uniref:sortase n=1 Tax=Mycetocola sp. 2940 TaxID=3156452 RepID=UPI00339601BD
MFKKVLATLALATMAFFAVPAAANAYGPNSNGTVVGPIVPGQSVTIVFGPNAFSGSSNVSFTVSGNSVVTLGAFKAATTTSFEKKSNADGSIELDVTLPENASGTYSITGTDVDGNIGTASLTVPASDAGSGNLPDTGSEVPVLALWTAGGALALGAGLIAVMTLVRRQRLSQD